MGLLFSREWRRPESLRRRFLRALGQALGQLAIFALVTVLTFATLAFIVLYPDLGTVLACAAIVILAIIEAFRKG